MEILSLQTVLDAERQMVVGATSANELSKCAENWLVEKNAGTLFFEHGVDEVVQRIISSSPS